MNIKDVKDFKMCTTPLASMFSRQLDLALKYKEIEKMGTLLEDTATNINTKSGQLWIKEFAWRVTEELAEAIEPIELNKKLTEDHILHYFEELADALHFLIELAIISGYIYTDFEFFFRIEVLQLHELKTSMFVDNNLIQSLRNHHWNIVYSLGLMCNTLKNKRWKQTEMLTDRVSFEKYLKQSFAKLFFLFGITGYRQTDIYNVYFKKSKVNQFRQETNY